MNKMEAVNAITFQGKFKVKDSTISTPPESFRADSANPNTTATQKVTNDGLIAEGVEEIYNFTGNSNNDALEDDAKIILPMGKYQCFMCSFNCTRKCDLTKHLEKHFSPRDCFPCTVCKRQFPKRQGLERHINSCADIRSYQCDKCDKSFIDKYVLKVHLKETHSGMKPFKCTKCDFDTIALSSLTRHLVVHMEDRPFKCLHCSYTSKRKDNLKRHTKIHTDDKDYKCDICYFRFGKLDSLRKHLKKHFKPHVKTPQ